MADGKNTNTHCQKLFLLHGCCFRISLHKGLFIKNRGPKFVNVDKKRILLMVWLGCKVKTLYFHASFVQLTDCPNIMDFHMKPFYTTQNKAII